MPELMLMDKGALKIKRKRKSDDYITFDPRISADRKTFVLRVECTCKANWYEFLNFVFAYAKDEIDKLDVCEGPPQ